MLHGDIKPANILIKGDIFKLCDFGTTLILDENKQCNFEDYTTTEPFMPPEGTCSSLYHINYMDISGIISLFGLKAIIHQGVQYTVCLVQS